MISLQKPNEESQNEFNETIQETYKDGAYDRESRKQEDLNQKRTALIYAVEQAAEEPLTRSQRRNKRIIDQRN